MAKKIAVINDLSGFGKCSLTAAIPVIASMGVQPCPLPTAILSAQTGYPSYFLDEYTERMERIYREWEKMKVRFDGIYSGFLANTEQIRQVHNMFDLLGQEGTFLLVDPVMGDNGARFEMFSEGFQSRMRELAARAHLITPNFTELCLLAGEDPAIAGEEREGEEVKERASDMAEGLMKEGCSQMVVTGIRLRDREGHKIGNLVLDGEKRELLVAAFVGESYSGTGDLFASVIAAGKVRGMALGDSVRLAQRFLVASIEDAVRRKVPRNEGVEFENHLGILTRACNDDK